QLHRCLMTSESRAREVGLQLQEYQVLLAVKSHGEADAPTIGALATRLQTDRGTLGELVENLAARDFLRRERDQSDRRRVLISLTPAGERWLVSLSDEVLGGLAKSGLSLFRALRVVLAHAATGVGREQAPTRNELELQAWRPMTPTAV